MDDQIERYLDILRKDPDNQAAFQYLEEVFFLEGNWRDLLCLYQGQVLRDIGAAQKAEIYFKMGKVQEKDLSEVNLAVESYTMACRCDPTHRGALECLMEAYLRNGQFAQAIQVGEMIEPLVRQDRLEHLKLLQNMWEISKEGLRQPEMTFELSRSILRLDPNDSKVLNALNEPGITPERWRNLVMEIDQWASDVSLAMHRDEYLLLKARILLEHLRDVDGAISLLRKLPDTSRTIQQSKRKGLAQALEVRGDFQGLAETLQGLVNILGDSEEKLGFLEKLALINQDKLRDNLRALAIWRRILEISPAHEEAFRYLRTFFLERKDWKSLVDLLAKRIGSETDETVVTALFTEMGRIFQFQLKAPEKAIRCYERASQSHADDVEIIQALLDLYHQVKAPDRVKKLEGKLKVLAGQGSLEAWTAMTLYQASALRQKDSANAIALYREILMRDPLCERAVEGLKALYTERQDWKALIHLLEARVEVVATSSEKAELLVQIATLIVNRIKDADRAIPYLRKALVMDPNHRVAARAIEDLLRKRENWGDLLHLLTKKLTQVDSEQDFVSVALEMADLFEHKFKQLDKAYDMRLRVMQVESIGERGMQNLRQLIRLALATTRSTDALQFMEDLLEKTEEPAERLTLLRCALATMEEAQTKDNVRKARYLQEVIRLAPEDLESLRQLEQVYASEGRFEELRAQLKSALTRTNTPHLRVEIAVRLAQVLDRHLNQEEEAIEHWEMVRKLEPSRLESLAALFRLYGRKRAIPQRREVGVQFLQVLREQEKGEQWLGTLEEFAQFVWNDVQDLTEARERFEELYRAKKARGLAVTDVLESLEVITRNLGAHALYAEILDRRLQITQQPKELIRLYNALGEVEMKVLHHDEHGCSCWEKSLEIGWQHNQDQTDLFERFVSHLEETRQWQRLNALLSRYLENGHLSLRERDRLLARKAIILGDHLQEPLSAIEVLSEIVSRDPGNLLIWMKMEEFCERSGDRETQAEVLKKLTLLCLEQGQKAESSRYLEKLVRMFSDGITIDERKDFARRLFEQDQGNLMAFHVLRDVYREQGPVGELIALLERQREFIKGTREEKEIVLELADLYEAHLEDREKAKGLREAILLLPGKSLDLSDRGWMANLLQVYRQSETWLNFGRLGEEVLAISQEESVDFYRELAEVFQRHLHQKEKAAQYYLAAAERVLRRSVGPIPREEREEIFEPLLELLEGMEEWTTLSDVLEQLAQKTEDRAERETILTRVVQIYLHQLDKSAEAERVLRTILEADPLHPQAFDLLCGILKDRRDDRGLVEVFEKRAERTVDLKEATTLLIAAGHIWERSLNDQREAILCYQRALEIVPQEFDDWKFTERLEELYRQHKDWPALCRLLEKLSSHVSGLQKANVLFRLGALVESELEDLDYACEIYSRVLFENASHKGALQALCKLSIEQEKWQESANYLTDLLASIDAEDAGERSQAWKSDTVRYLEKLGEIYELHLADPERAAAVYEKVLELEPGHVDSMRRLARLYWALREWADLARIEDALLRVLDNPVERMMLLIQLASVYSEHLGAPQKAIAHFVEVLEMDPGHREAFYGIRPLLKQQGLLEQLVRVEEEYLKTVKKAQEGYEIMEDLARVLDERLERPLESVAYFVQLAEGRGDLFAIRRLIAILSATDRIRELERAYRLLLEQPLEVRERQDTLLKLGLLLLERLQMPEEGVEILEEVMQSREKESPGDSAEVIFLAANALATFYANRQDEESEERVLRQGVHFAPDQEAKSELLARLGRVQQALGRYEQARETYEQVLAIENHEEVLKGMIEILPFMEAWQPLRAIWERLLQVSSDPSQCHLHLGALILQRFPGEEAKALEHLEEVIIERPLDVEARRLLGCALERLEMWSRWVDSVGAEIALEPDVTRQAVLLGQKAFVLNVHFQRKDEAIDLSNQALLLDPTCHLVRHLLVSLYLEVGQTEQAMRILLDGLNTHERTYDLQTLLAYAAYISSEVLQDTKRGWEYLKRAISLMDQHQPHLTACRLFFSWCRRDGVKLQDDPLLEEMYALYDEVYGSREGGWFYSSYAQSMGSSPAVTPKRIELLRKALHLDPDRRGERYELAFLLFESQQFEEARQYFHLILDQEPHHEGKAAILRAAAQCHLFLKDQAGFDSLFVQLLEVEDGDVELGRAFFKDIELPERQSAIRLVLERALEVSRPMKNRDLRSLFGFVLGRLMQIEGEDDQVIREHFKRVAKLAGEGSVVRSASYFMVGEYEEKAQNEEYAITCYEKALGDLGQIQLNASTTHSCIETWSSFLPRAFCPQWPEISVLNLRLARLWEGSNEKRAAQYYQDYFEANPGEEGIAGKLMEWYERWQENAAWERVLAHVIDQRLSRPFAKMDDRRECGELLFRMGSLRMNKLGDRKGAIWAFEQLREIQSEDDRSHLALAVLYEGEAKKEEDCLQEHEWLLERDPLRIPSYRYLFTHYQKKGEWQKAAHLAEILCVLREATREEEEIAQMRVKKDLVDKGLAIPAAERLALLVHRRQVNYFGDLFSLMKKGLERLVPLDLKTLGLEKSDRVDASAPIAVKEIWERLQRIYRAFGGDALQVYWDRSSQNRFLLGKEKTPTLVISSDFPLLYSKEEQDFLFGQAIQWFLDDTVFVCKMKVDDLEKIVTALLKMIDPDSTVALSKEDLENTQKTISKIGRKAKKNLRPLLQQYVNPDTRVEIRDWITAVKCTANRGGLVVCGSVGVACEVMARAEGFERRQGPEMLAKIIRHTRAIQDVLSFAATRRYFSLRERLT